MGKVIMETKNNLKLNSDFSIVDFLMYFGGFTLFLGIYYFVFNFWETMGSFFQIFFTLIVSILLIFSGIYLNKRLNLYKLGSPLLFLSYFLFPLGMYVLNSRLELVTLFSENYIITFLVSSLVFAFVYKTVESNFSLFFSLTYYMLFYFSLITRLLKDYFFSLENISTNNVLSSSFLFFGLSGHFLARYFEDKSKIFYYFINFVSVNFLLFGLWFFNFFFRPSEEVTRAWMIIFPAVILYLIIYSKRIGDLFLRIFSVIYLVIYVLYMIYKNISSEFFIPSILIIIGLLLISGGFYYYTKKPIQSSNDIN